MFIKTKVHIYFNQYHFYQAISQVKLILSPVITAEWMYHGSCHPKSLAGLGSAEHANSNQYNCYSLMN